MKSKKKIKKKLVFSSDLVNMRSWFNIVEHTVSDEKHFSFRHFQNLKIKILRSVSRLNSRSPPQL